MTFTRKVHVFQKIFYTWHSIKYGNDIHHYHSYLRVTPDTFVIIAYTELYIWSPDLFLLRLKGVASKTTST